MRFRPCIDIHNGKVKQIVGSSLRDEGDSARENYVSGQGSAWYAKRYAADGLTGGHVILLNSRSSDRYPETLKAALTAFQAAPGTLMAGGGITPENAGQFLEAGASHVIVTSYVFSNGEIDRTHLAAMTEAVGREHLVLDLSCRKAPDGRWMIMTDRWQKQSREAVDEQLLDELAGSCSEFLIHAVDVEGKGQGPQEELIRLLGAWQGLPVTYAGGIRSLQDLKRLEEAGRGRIDFTIGSALDLFGGTLPYAEVVQRYG